ncbi:hypothetical protein TMatcc_004216 [Talaromyces marneffei ATCC 18224]
MAAHGFRGHSKILFLAIYRPDTRNPKWVSYVLIQLPSSVMGIHPQQRMSPYLLWPFSNQHSGIMLRNGLRTVLLGVLMITLFGAGLARDSDWSFGTLMAGDGGVIAD